MTQDYVLEFIKKFMIENENLMLLDLSHTGIDDWGIIELVNLVKNTIEVDSVEAPNQMRNLASLHLTCNDPKE